MHWEPDPEKIARSSSSDCPQASSSELRTALDSPSSHVRLKHFVGREIGPRKVRLWNDEVILQYSGDEMIGDLVRALDRGVAREHLLKRFPAESTLQTLRELVELDWLISVADEEPALETNDCNIGVLEAWVSGDNPDAAESLRISRAAIIGVGGVGSEIAVHLAAAGIGSLVLCDPDTVQSENFNRQYSYRPRHISTPKVEALAHRLAETYPAVAVECHRTKITRSSQLDIFAHCNLVIQAADDLSVSLDRMVARWADELNAGYICASVGIDCGYWGPLSWPHRTPSATMLWDRLEGQASTAGTVADRRATPWSLGATNSLVSAFAARDVIAAIIGASKIPSLGARMKIRFSDATIARLDMNTADND